MRFVFLELKMLNTVQVKNVDPCRIHDVDTLIHSYD